MILALITRSEDVGLVLPWALRSAVAHDAKVTVLCCSAAAEQSADELYQLVRSYLDARDKAAAEVEVTALNSLPADRVSIVANEHSQPTLAAVEAARATSPDLLVAAAADTRDARYASYTSNALLRDSPCTVIVLFGETPEPLGSTRLLVGATDSAHDSTALNFGVRLTGVEGTKANLARVEEDHEDAALAVGERELRQLIRDAGISKKQVRARVYPTSRRAELIELIGSMDFMLVGANEPRTVAALLELEAGVSIGVLKRLPPIRPWQKARRARGTWEPRISPADYAELIQGLRRGSRLSFDFVMMLGLAAAIAAIGLIQDSAAVVVGSMLLAPLMTPMLGVGLALAQANPKLGNQAARAIAGGVLLALAISLLVGVVTPGSELTPQILARGQPTLLDLGVALFSATAAAYALARPTLAGSIAGVAIATALVPPLCSVGISVAYLEFTNAIGAALLFGINFVAIVLAAAVTFRAMGITAARANVRQRRWVLGVVVAMAVPVLVIVAPLQEALLHSVDTGKAQPRTFPLTAAVDNALEQFTRRTPGVRLISGGRPASPHDEADVFLVIGTARTLEPDYAEELADLVRREMDDPELTVEVHCIPEAWQQIIRPGVEPSTTSGQQDNG